MRVGVRGSTKYVWDGMKSVLWRSRTYKNQPKMVYFQFFRRVPPPTFFSPIHHPKGIQKCHQKTILFHGRPQKCIFFTALEIFKSTPFLLVPLKMFEKNGHLPHWKRVQMPQTASKNMLSGPRYLKNSEKPYYRASRRWRTSSWLKMWVV